MNGLKRKEEVNELDEHIETKPSGSNVAHDNICGKQRFLGPDPI